MSCGSEKWPTVPLGFSLIGTVQKERERARERGGRGEKAATNLCCSPVEAGGR